MPEKVISVLGPSGQIGSDLMLKMPTANPIFRSKVNLLNPFGIAEALAAEKFDILINCAGLSDVEYCEEHPDEADAVNHRTIEEVAKYCANNGKKFIHVSDGGMVFDGTSPKPYAAESDDYDFSPINYYGKSKVLGEAAVRTVFENSKGQYCIVRAASVFGPAIGRKNFLEKLISSAMRVKEGVKVASWRLMSPTSARTVASAISHLLTLESLPPVFNVACKGGPVTQSEAAAFALSKIPSLAHIKIVEVAKPGKGLPRIPPNTALEPTDLEGFSPNTWQEEVENYLLQKGYARPECALEVEADADTSVGKVWEKLQRGTVSLDNLVEALRTDRMNWMAGSEGPGRKAKKGFWEKLGGPAEEKESE